MTRSSCGSSIVGCTGPGCSPVPPDPGSPGTATFRSRGYDLGPRTLASRSAGDFLQVGLKRGQVEAGRVESVRLDEVLADHGERLVSVGVVEPPAHRLDLAPGHDVEVVRVIGHGRDAVAVVLVRRGV